MNENKNKRCFIITPIGDESSGIRRHIEGIIDAVIEPALGEKYEIIVAHRISEQGLITKQVITEIYNDELVIANITDRNPNVMYELAVRHTLGKPTIMIAEKGTSLPSDIIMQRTIFYHNDAKGVLELREELKKAESKIEQDKKCGPIIDILGDISQDVTLIQSIESKNVDEVEQLRYIVSRLNKIEEAISANARQSKFYGAVKDLFPPRRIMATFDKYIGEDIDSLEIAIRNNMGGHCKIYEINISLEKKTLVILYSLFLHSSPENVYDTLELIAQKYGLEGFKFDGAVGSTN